MGKWADGGQGDRPAFNEHAGRLSLTKGQAAVVCALCAWLIVGAIWHRQLTITATILLFQLGFLGTAAWRAALISVSLRPAPQPTVLTAMTGLPRYTVLVALFEEAEIVGQLIERLSQIDYPEDRLEGFIVLEADDHQTRAAIEQLRLPPWISILTAPDAGHRTKPRALNVGLARATGEFLTVYDAEDDPHPLQLREAVARFQTPGAADVWALQAPLRIRLAPVTRSAFLDRQFAIEYAALFEVMLPGLARLGLPFPLGGTSNHFRASALRKVGGWDPLNVTEDADISYRLWRAGGRLETLTRPTYEPPPGALDLWLPQRTRWLKGFMQTWGVHTRDLRGLGGRGLLSLTMTLGVAIASAALHAVSIAWITATLLIALAAGLWPQTPLFAVSVLGVGALAAWVTAAIGCRRVGFDYRLQDLAFSPAYWSLLSLALLHAVWRLVREPFAWDKTRHFVEPACADAATVPATGRNRP